MKEKSKPVRIIEEAYNTALSEFNKDKGRTIIEGLPQNVRFWIAEVGKVLEKHKATVAVLTTLLTKKVETPSQDIRYHRTDLEGAFLEEATILFISPPSLRRNSEQNLQ